MSVSRSRKYQITQNNPDNYGLTSDMINETMKELKWQYYCFEFEFGAKENTPHFHLYFVCENAVGFINQKLCGNEYIKNDYIFKWDNGKPYTPDYVSRKFGRILNHYGLRKIRFHDLRHSCASLLVANGFQLKDIQEWLGHADIQTTANIYAHLDIERKNKIANSMSNSFAF